MKIVVTLKDPDTLHDAVEDAFNATGKPEGVSVGEWSDIRDARAAEVRQRITTLWMPFGEYLTVEFDTDAGTATVAAAR